MTSTTVADFGAKTDALTVVGTFPSSIRGRTILVTGVNKLGIGYGTTMALASQSPRFLIVTGRSLPRLEECLDILRQNHPAVDFRPLLVDLACQTSVRKAAAEFLSWKDVPAVDIVINNAGIMNIPERTLTEDGVELHFATNHVGHFLFTNLIMPKIIASAMNGPAGTTRIINVSSMATAVSPLRGSDINWDKPASQLSQSERPNLELIKGAGLDVSEETTYIPMAAYGCSKTANILYSVSLNKRLHEKYGILSLALNPGEIRTELHRTTDKVWLENTMESRKNLGAEWKTAEQGPSTTLVAALDPKLAKPDADGRGQFLNDCQIASMTPSYALDQDEADKLWSISEGLVKEKFSW